MTTDELTTTKKNLLLAVLYGGAFMAAFNENIINVALIDIEAEFAIDAVLAQWLVTGYMIVASTVVASMSFLSRRLALRPMFFSGAAILIGGSLGALLAPNFPAMLAFRLVQAIGTGMFIPTMMNAVLRVAPRAKLGTYLSIGSCCITLGPAFGPVVSGLMVTLGGWRAIFVPTTVVMAVLAICAVFFLQNITETSNPKLDLLSEVFAAAGLTLVVFGLTQLTTALAAALVALVVGLVLVALFSRRQLKLEDPMMNIRPMANPRFSIAIVLAVVGMMNTFSMSVLLPLYFQGSLGYSALVSGLLILVPIALNSIGALVGGRIMDSKGEWPLLPIGFGLITVGQIAEFVVSPSMEIGAVMIASAVVYCGVGLVMSPSQTAGLKTLTMQEHPHGTSVMNTFVQMAGALGPSLFVGILSSSAYTAVAGGSSAQLGQAIGFSHAVAVAAFIGLAGTVISFFYARSAAKAAASAQQTEQKASLELTVDSLMKRDVIALGQDATVRDAVALFASSGTSGVPVIGDERHVVGFLSSQDIIQALGGQSNPLESLGYLYLVDTEQEEPGLRRRELMDAPVMDYAVKHVIAVETGTAVDDACSLMAKHRIKKLPVIDGERLVGTLSRGDIMRNLMGYLSK